MKTESGKGNSDKEDMLENTLNIESMGKKLNAACERIKKLEEYIF